ncbi:MAG: TylF/MycF/NovP-related O-methyltransferase [bacterium]|nr:TylF/MycF/NovP-related O-methyltransferase [bacterium]
MIDHLKNIFRPITPKIVKKIYKFFRIDLEDYVLLPKRNLQYASDGLYTFNSADFRKDPLFKESYDLARKIDDDQLLSQNDIPWRMHVLYWAGNHAKNIPGDFIDCGVNTGFCPRSLMHYIGFKKLNKRYFLLDTFSGLDPKYSTEKELIGNKFYSTQTGLYEKVKKTFSGFNVSIIKGSVPDTLSQVKTPAICFLHLDMNAAAPELAALDFFWEKISKGGIVLFDDYGFKEHADQKKTQDVWAKKHNVEILSLPTGQGLLIKK